MTSPRLLQRELAMNDPPRRQLQAAPAPHFAGLNGFERLNPTAGPDTDKAVNEHTDGFNASLGDQGQGSGHQSQVPQQLGIVNKMEDTSGSHGSVRTVTLHPQIAPASRPFSQFAQSVTNMTASQPAKGLEMPATSSAPFPPNQPVAHRDLLTYNVCGGDAIGGGQLLQTAPGGVFQDETTSTNDAKVPAKKTSEWDEARVLSGFPHPRNDLPREMELRDICRLCPNHLNKERLDPFIQCDWTEKNIIDEMDEATVLRMQDLPGCKNFRETLSRRLRARRRKLGPEGIARLRAAELMHPAHMRGKSRQSGMLDPVKYAARLAEGQQKKQEKMAKVPQKACNDGLSTANPEHSTAFDSTSASLPQQRGEPPDGQTLTSGSRHAVTDAAAAASPVIATTATYEHDRMERAIGILQAVPAISVSSGANNPTETSDPPKSKPTQPADGEEEDLTERSRLDISLSQNAKHVGQTATHRPVGQRHGSENFSPSYLQETERMSNATSSGIRKYIMPETTSERRNLRNSASTLVERRMWNRAMGLWEIEVLDKQGDVVDEYLEKHHDGCPCCPRL